MRPLPHPSYGLPFRLPRADCRETKPCALRKRPAAKLVFPPATPFPHAKHGFLRNRMADLPCQHADLPAVMGVVGDEVSDKAGYIRLEAPHPAVAFQCSLQNFRQRIAAL